MAKHNVTSTTVGDFIQTLIEKGKGRRDLLRERSENMRLDDNQRQIAAVRMTDAIGYLHGIRQLQDLYARFMEDDLK